jgi:hypothetical protein
MVTKYPHRIAPRAEPPSSAHAHQAEDGFGTRMFDRVRQMLCALHGHDNLLLFERDRLSLKCSTCGHETPGWELSETPPTPTAASHGDARRHALVRPQLVGARRIA